MTIEEISFGGHERYALVPPLVHALDCPGAQSIPGDGGYVESVERGEELGGERCPDCLEATSVEVAEPQSAPHRHSWRKDNTCRCGESRAES